MGHREEHELQPGGRTKRVSLGNGSEYMRLSAQHEFADRVSDSLADVLAGFNEVARPDSIPRQEDWRVLQQTFAGEPNISVDEWRAHTAMTTSHAVTDDHARRVVEWVWKFLREENPKTRSKALFWITATRRLPAGGFNTLSSSWMTIAVVPEEPHGSLPKAHTCMRSLEIPAYSSYHALYTKLTMAIEEGGGFWIA